MPYEIKWVPPEVFIEHAGVTVYHTYKDQQLESGPRSYYFTLSKQCGEEECECPEEANRLIHRCKNVFDVRDLPTWEPTRKLVPIEEKAIRIAILNAIYQGILKAPPAL
jgi:hypothetical protein